MMDELNVRLDKLIRQGNLPKATSRRIFYILERQKIPYYKALRLLVLLNKLRDDRFRDLSTAEKKKLFRNLSDLMSYRDEEKIREVCYLLLEGRLPRKSSAFFLPHDMTKSMISAGKREKSKDLKEMIWDFLLRKEIRLNEFILPDDLFFGLKAENPIFRNNTIRYLFAHFKPDTILDGIIEELSKTGEPLSSFTFRRMTGLAREEEQLKQRKLLLVGILGRLELPDDQIHRIWSDYLRGLNRFELIKVFSTENDTPAWVDDFREKTAQLSFGFGFPQEISARYCCFEHRAAAILDEMDQWERA